MTLKRYLFIMALLTGLCWLVFTYILFTINPDSTNWIGFMLFYASLFLSLAGTAALAGFLVRFAVLKRELMFRAVYEAFRQSFMFAFLIIASLFLLSKGLFTWLNLGLLVLGLAAIEFFLLSYLKGQAGGGLRVRAGRGGGGRAEPADRA